MIVNSFRSNAEVSASPVGLPKELYLDNFRFFFEHVNFPLAVLNSLVLTVGAVILIIVFGSAASWTIARVMRRWATGAYRDSDAGRRRHEVLHGETSELDSV